MHAPFSQMSIEKGPLARFWKEHIGRVFNSEQRLYLLGAQSYCI